MNKLGKIRVLHFIGKGEIGGQEKALYQLFRSFKSDPEFELGVTLGSDKAFYTEKIRKLGLPIIQLDLKSGLDFKVNRALLNKLREYNIHHFHDPTPNVILLSLLCGPKIKRVFTRRGGFHNYKNKGLKIWLKYFLNRFLIKTFFDGFSGNTFLASEFVKHFFRIKNKKIYVLYNGLYFEDMNPDIPSEDILNILNLSKSDFKIGTACHLIKLKRVDLIIHSFNLCKVEKKKLIIIGKGDEEIKLKKLAKNLGLDKKIIFLGEVTKISNYLQIMDCFILASGNEESFGNAVVEAMYFGIPSIVMKDSEGLKEHVIENKTGFIAKDETDLARKMEFIFENPEIAKKVAEKGSIYVQDKYSVKNMVNAYKNFYYDVLKTGR